MALTKQEVAALGKASAIIVKHTPNGASWSFSFHANGMYSTAAYFDSAGAQHMLWEHSTLSDAVQAGIELELAASLNADALKLAKIERLKAELYRLTGESA